MRRRKDSYACLCTHTLTELSLQIFFEELLQCLCSLCFLIAIRADRDLLSLLHTKPHNTKDTLCVCFLAVLDDRLPALRKDLPDERGYPRDQ